VLASELTLEHGKILVIVGPIGSGKTKLARDVARRYGKFIEAPSYILNSLLRFGSCIWDAPTTLILEVDDAISREALYLIKLMITNDTLVADRQYSRTKCVKSPFLILVLSNPADLGMLGDRRLVVYSTETQNIIS